MVFTADRPASALTELGPELTARLHKEGRLIVHEALSDKAEAAFVAGQEEGGGGHLVGAAKAAEWDQLGERVARGHSVGPRGASHRYDRRGRRVQCGIPARCADGKGARRGLAGGGRLRLAGGLDASATI